MIGIVIFILLCWAMFATVYAWQLFKDVEWYAIRHGDIKERSKINWEKQLKKVVKEGHILILIMITVSVQWVLNAVQLIRQGLSKKEMDVTTVLNINRLKNR